MSYSILFKTELILFSKDKENLVPSMFEHFYENKEIDLQTIYKLHLMLIDYLEIQQ
jgi:hypothetical protein